MSSNSEGEEKQQSDQQFTGDKKKSSKKVSKSKQKKAPKGKAGKKPKEKEKKEGKQGKQQKQVKKKKPSKSKDKGGNIEKDTEVVREYLEKQNRPYNLLNIFDNLHGSIKKAALQTILENLVGQKLLTCKQFGKNKVYYLNQQRFEINPEQIQKLGIKLSQAREETSKLQARHKSLSDELRKLLAMKTETQMKQQIQTLQKQIERLEKKQQKLLNGLESKMDEQVVIKAEKQQEKLRKDLKKYKKIKKEAINSWSQNLQKKPAEVAQIMGVDL